MRDRGGGERMGCARLPRLWQGGRVYIAACGPSLDVVDLETIRGSRLVVVNLAFRLAPWADVLYACDGKWWDTYRDPCYGMPWTEFAGLKVTQDPRADQWGALRIPLEPDPEIVNTHLIDGLSLDPMYIRGGGNSGYQAINVAIHLGAAEIVLLGFDCRKDGGRRHFHEDHPAQMNNPDDSNFASWARAFETMIPDLERAGVGVINCSRETALECFPTMRLEDLG